LFLLFLGETVVLNLINSEIQINTGLHVGKLYVRKTPGFVKANGCVSRRIILWFETLLGRRRKKHSIELILFFRQQQQ